MNGPRSDAAKFVEVVAQESKVAAGTPLSGTGKLRARSDGEVFGACRDCECKGLISFEDDWEDE